MIHINDPYVDVLKKLNIKVFNLISRTNETRHIKWHGTCKCKCRLVTINNARMKINVDVNVKK